MKASDGPLLRHVQREIRSGKKEITVQADLLAGASKDGIAEAHVLCKLSGVRILKLYAR